MIWLKYCFKLLPLSLLASRKLTVRHCCSRHHTYQTQSLEESTSNLPGSSSLRISSQRIGGCYATWYRYKADNFNLYPSIKPENHDKDQHCMIAEVHNFLWVNILHLGRNQQLSNWASSLLSMDEFIPDSINVLNIFA